ncbi:MAG: PrgI family protein [Patescibacteria group bacterium]
MTQQFQVPQFIDVEDKVIGPFTIKQFVFLGAGGLLIVLLRNVFEGFVLYVFSLIIASVAGALAFLKINGQPLPLMVKNAFFFFINPRLYVWKQEQAKKRPTEKEKEEVKVAVLPKLSVSKLNDLAWSLDQKNQERSER